MDSNSGQPPKIHPCLCGFETDKYSKMKKHREACTTWQSRPNPMRLMIERRKTTKVERPEEVRSLPCGVCGNRQDHHDSSCPNSQAEKVRRELVARHRIHPDDWEIILFHLGKRYPPPHR